jgi:hypothetical protein
VIPCKEISIASLLAETGRPKAGYLYPRIPTLPPEHEIQGEKAADRVQSKKSAELALARCVMMH